ncbi:nucleoside recognition domain-containing protein [Paenibacillus planticolens]|uniref:nucleoside recognition domain-containing protein n=1 Tax=Paenibacillus planticolens TaxID=2654976 RepID=UPI0028AFE263|nr:nucleoside recognition domain-containing protein [Paenibacillus planticolens]
MLAEAASRRKAVVLAGLESSGKSALFRSMTGHDTGEEANFRGSTVMVRKARLTSDAELIDIPGIKSRDDSYTTRLAFREMTDADMIVLVVRATHAAMELPALLEAMDVARKRLMLVLTFADKAIAGLSELAHYYHDALGIPVHTIDARNLQEADKQALLQTLEAAKPIRSKAMAAFAPEVQMLHPQSTWFEHRRWGRPLALLSMLALFALPVLLAYELSSRLQSLADLALVEPFKALVKNQPEIVQTLLTGDYGLVTLGIYSFLWAFPVVLLLGISVAVTEESGLKDRIADSLDGWLRYIGLNGRDLIPVLSGFGCNVVAVFQSRACSACTRKSCVTLISYGSACSYQIGASLSIFGSAGHPWLFAPYLLLLFIVGAWHTRLWSRGPVPSHPSDTASKTYLQKPSARAVGWRVRAVIKQFLLQAMPIFIGICLAAALLQYIGALQWLSRGLGPVLHLFQLPAEAAGGIIFSILRKDGLLILNQDEGVFLHTLQPGIVFVLVYAASTLTACLVTLWTLRKEMGWSFAGSLAAKQAITSMVTTFLLAAAVHSFL